MVSGQVQDSTSAIIQCAKVELRRSNGAVAATAMTNSAGQFRIPQPAPGEYRLDVASPGFEPLDRAIRIRQTPITPLVLTMKLASVATSVTVHADANAEIGAPDQNQDSTTVSSDDMKTLPILDGDVVSTLSAFLDAGVVGEGGVTLMVDGVERSSIGVSPSAIERISINQNPYSAQYRQPGKGQVEVVTKSTEDKFHGEASFTFRDSTFDATNYFAKTKPSDQRRTYEGYLTGPIKPLRNTTFLFSFDRQEEDYFAEVNAIVVDPANPTGPNGIAFNQNVPAPYRNTDLTMKVAHQINDHHSVYVLYGLSDIGNTLQNGGLTLASAGSVERTFNMDLTFHDDLDFGAHRLNQLTLMLEHNSDNTSSNQQMPAIVVQGAFTAGGAQIDNFQTLNQPDATDIVSWTTHKIHQLKFGLMLTNLGRFALDDLNNRQGSYTFANLATFEADTPLSYTVQQGKDRFITRQVTPSGFFLDQIQASPRLTVTPGVRYDFQSTLSGTKDAVLPRLSLAYVLEKKHALVVRTGGGVYMRRVGSNIAQDIARFGNAAETSLLLTTNLSYPIQPSALVAQPPSLFTFEPNIKAPMQAYFGMSIERQLTKKSTITLSYDGYRGWHALRSVDVNAPLPPFNSPARPNPNYSQVRQIQSRGYQKSDGMTLSYRGRIRNVFSGSMQYVVQHADSNTQWSTFMPQNQYDPNNEWSRADTDQRQRLSMLGTFYPDKPLNLGFGFYNNTPTPYSITTGTDAYMDGLTNARPAGVPRNTLNSNNYQDLDLRAGYKFKLHPQLKDKSPTVAFSLSSFNTLNRVNYEGYVGVITSPLFTQPTSADQARRLQLGASYEF